MLPQRLGEPLFELLQPLALPLDPFGLQFLPFGFKLFHLLGGLPLDLFQFIAAAVEIGDQCCGFPGFGGEFRLGSLHHRLGQAEAPGDFDAAREARHADEQPVGGPQVGLVEFYRGVEHAWRRRGVCLQRSWCVVASVRQRRLRNSSRSATASAEPSSGAVPVPISSASTSECSVAASSILFRFSMCDENVERSAAMDCSSPISTSTRSNSGSSARSAATGMPDCAASAASPTVLSATVLPPVLGPLITSTVSSPPSSSVIGTTARPSRRSLSSSTGWRAASSVICESALKAGSAQLNSRAKRARAKVESSSPIVAAANWIGPRSACSRSVSSRRIRAISAASSSASWTSLLLSSMASSGSTNTVWPVALEPCTTPCTCRRSAERTGITKRSLRRVT